MDDYGMYLTVNETNAIRMVMERGCRRQEEKVRDLLRIEFGADADIWLSDFLIPKMRRLGLM